MVVVEIWSEEDNLEKSCVVLRNEEATFNNVSTIVSPLLGNGYKIVKEWVNKED